MKGIIIDLDNTLWGGVVGEVSVEGVQIGGFYEQFQNLLDKLSNEGYLLAIASKNSLNIVKEVFKRRAMMVRLDAFFPIKANYNDKSKSVSEILKDWNILAKDVLFIDDREFELEEVKRQHPDIVTMLVPERSADFPWFFDTIRGLFPKKEITIEDKLRLESIRSGVQYAAEEKTADPEEFHKSLDATITIHKGFTDRALELVNKTNQFTTNGLRIMTDDWEIIRGNPDSFCYTFEYTDRFGPLGVVGTLMGFQDNNEIFVSHMALSCRAFSRRIEYQMLDFLFRLGVEKVSILILETASNEPARKFATDVFGKLWFGGFDTISKIAYDERKPKLYQRVICHNCD